MDIRTGRSSVGSTGSAQSTGSIQDIAKQAPEVETPSIQNKLLELFGKDTFESAPPPGILFAGTGAVNATATAAAPQKTSKDFSKIASAVLDAKNPKIDASDAQALAKSRSTDVNAWKAAAAKALGVKPDDINVITGAGENPALNARAGKINVYVGPGGPNEPDGPSGETVKVGGSLKDPLATLGTPEKAAVVLNIKAFAGPDPKHAARILFHESMHLEHNEMVNAYHDKFMADPNVSKAAKAMKSDGPFNQWLGERPELTKKADAAGKANLEMMRQLIDPGQNNADTRKANADTEAIAHVRTALRSLKERSPGVSLRDAGGAELEELELPPGTRAQELLRKEFSKADPALQKELKAAYGNSKNLSWLFE